MKGVGALILYGVSFRTLNFERRPLELYTTVCRHSELPMLSADPASCGATLNQEGVFKFAPCPLSDSACVNLTDTPSAAVST